MGSSGPESIGSFTSKTGDVFTVYGHWSIDGQYLFYLDASGNVKQYPMVMVDFHKEFKLKETDRLNALLDY